MAVEKDHHQRKGSEGSEHGRECQQVHADSASREMRYDLFIRFESEVERQRPQDKNGQYKPPSQEEEEGTQQG